MIRPLLCSLLAGIVLLGLSAMGELQSKWNTDYAPRVIEKLESEGLVVNVLPKRDTLLEHLGDVAQHRCVLGGDSLPMHLALGMGVPCVSLFTCTSPWEIHEYGLLTKLVSPVLEDHFYQRSYDHSAASAISIEDVFNATMERLQIGCNPSIVE